MSLIDNLDHLSLEDFLNEPPEFLAQKYNISEACAEDMIAIVKEIFTCPKCKKDAEINGKQTES